MSSQYSAPAWGGPSTKDVKLPTGAFVQIRVLDVEELVEMDILSEIDGLTSLVNTEHVEPATGRKRIPQDRKRPAATRAEREEQEQKDASEMLATLSKDPDKFRTMLYVVDKVIVAAVLQPKNVTTCYAGYKDDFTKIPHESREPGLIYTDSIPMNDRFEIFGEALGKMGALQTFREGQEETLGALEGEPSDASTAE